MKEILSDISAVVKKFIIVLLVVVTGLSLISVIFMQGYKKGQIDAHNGFMKYELKVKTDGSTEWISK